MPIRDLKSQIARLPEQPGVYIYYNDAGETLYVGKARVLRDRVRSYLGAYGTSPRHDALLNEAERLETIVTDSVVEALALENHLIKQRQPRYNILLRDDKNYPYLQLTTTEAFPRVLVARRVERDGNVYVGPFMPAWLGRRTMSLTHRLFGIRSCNEEINGRRSRPCLEYDIKRCIAPCVAAICSEEQYQRAVADTRMFLEGRNEELVAHLRRRMAAAADEERFEEAGQLRDAIRTIETVATRQQKMSTPALGDRDAFGLKLGPAGAVVQVFQMRNGRVIERIELFAHAGAETEVETLEAAIQQFYEQRPSPPEIHVPIALPDQEREAIEAWLGERAERKIRVLVPRRGEKRGLLELATRNAAVAYNARFNENVAANYDALETLRLVLNLPALPRRIECFDISTFQGAETVASMVVCEDGRMKKADYRKFRIRGQRAEVGGQLAGSEGQTPEARRQPGGAWPLASDHVLDDFASMHEVVLRRYRKLLEHGGPFPDLVLIDGGKGQLNAAYSALEQLGLANLVAVGIAKKEELLFTREHDDPIALPSDSPALHLIQRIRDEAHRFAVTFHRRARSMRDLRSALDDVPGIGPRRRRTLLTRFGSLAGVRRATREELVRSVGARAADAVLAYFAANP
ncbi:MAG: excinuclease ABC subunit UvrC [Acidobacteriota bacterium]